MITPRPPSFWRAGQTAHTKNAAPIPRRSGIEVFTRFFYKKIAGAGQSPAAPRVGVLPAQGRVQGRAMPLPA